MGLIAASMFVALFVYHDDLLGTMTGANLKLALVTAFVFGIVCGYQVTKERKRR